MRPPNLSRVVQRWASPYTVKTVTTTTTDFVESKVVVGRTVSALIQPADRTKLTVEPLDWSLAYLLVHALEAVAIGDLIVYEGEDYKVVQAGPWLAFGYQEAVAEQTKRAVVAVTPVVP